ncbi:MAG: hypothetical protein K5675_03640 [Lachnospiraceae bacterium]|nr:hypothetical protein [Lachnospiraceae bacterium]
MDKKNYLNKEQIFIYLGLSLLYAVGIIFFLILLFGIDLMNTNPAVWVSLYSVITAVIWTYFLCKKLP